MILFRRRNLLMPTAALLISSITLVRPLPAQEQSSGQHRVWKVKESSALSELQKATGIHWSDASQVGSSKHLALEPPPAKGQDSLGRFKNERLVFVDRGYAIPSLEIVPIPPPPADCKSQISQSDAELDQARHNFEAAVNKEEPPESLVPAESTKPTLRLNTSRLSMKSILRNPKPCRWLSSVPSSE